MTTLDIIITVGLAVSLLVGLYKLIETFESIHEKLDEILEILKEE